MEEILLGWVLASKYRTKVLLAIKDYSMPSNIVLFSKIRFPHVSRALAELREKKIVKIVNPKANKGRLYTLTSIGMEIKKLIEIYDKD